MLLNVWMPHSGYEQAQVAAAHTAIGDLVCKWKASNYNVLAAGDWDAAVQADQRSSSSARTEHTDKVFRDMLVLTSLSEHTHCIEASWESTTGLSYARIDHVLLKDTSLALQCKVLRDATTSDHHALLVTLTPDVGCWNSGQHKPIVCREQLNFTEIDNLAPGFQTKMLEALSTLLASVPLEVVEQTMFTVAKGVFGLQKVPTGGKPFINHVVLAMKKAIRTLHTLLKKYTHPPSCSPQQTSDSPSALWDKLKTNLTLAGCKEQAAKFFTQLDADAALPDAWTTMSSTDAVSAIRQCTAALRVSIRKGGRRF